MMERIHGEREVKKEREVDRLTSLTSIAYTISQYGSVQRCAAIFSQDDPKRSLRTKSYGTISSEK